MIGSSLTAPNSETHDLPVMNLSDAPLTLYEGARIGEIYPVNSLKQAQEMLPVDPQLSDWDSDSNDAELVDVRMAINTDIGNVRKLPRYDECMNAHLNPKDLLEHLQPLMEWMTEDITPREQEELTAAIYEYRYVFSSRRDDMATHLVTHMIDARENNPVLSKMCVPSSDWNHITDAIFLILLLWRPLLLA